MVNPYLKKVSQIDHDIMNNKQEWQKFNDSNQLRIKVYNILVKFSSKKILTLNLIISSLIICLLVKKGVLAIFLTCGFWLIINSIVVYYMDKLNNDEEFFAKLDYYQDKHHDLINIRNTYVNLYNYLLKGDRAILENIKARAEKKNFYDYNLCIDKIWLHQDLVAYNLLQEMANKEERMVKDIVIDIKNKLYFTKPNEMTNYLQQMLTNLTFNNN